jgi:hypothetical protein
MTASVSSTWQAAEKDHMPIALSIVEGALNRLA